MQLLHGPLWVCRRCSVPSAAACHSVVWVTIAMLAWCLRGWRVHDRQKSILEPPNADSILLTSTHFNWTTTLYIAVQGYTASTFQVTAYSYQAVDDGVTVTSTLRPLEYAHFVGSPSTGVAELERDLSFATAMAVSRSGHAPVSLFAGAWEKYYPMVTEGFAEVSALDVQPGDKVAMQTPYVGNTGVTRQMVSNR